MSISRLNLEPVKRRLMDPDQGFGWTCAQADYYELKYKRFLILLAKHPVEEIAPSTNVDKFWYAHTLDGRKYAEDCIRVFGRFFPHFPYLRMRGQEDARNLAHAAANMRRLYRQEFGTVRMKAVAQ